MTQRKARRQPQHQVDHGKEHPANPLGKIAQLFPWEGYGFLRTPDGREIYFHERSVLHDGFSRLEVGSLVRFTEELGERGPQASTLARLHRRRSQ